MPFTRLRPFLLPVLLAASSSVLADHASLPLGPAVGAAFGPDGRLWRVLAEERSLRVEPSADLGLTFAAGARIEAGTARPRVSPEDPPQVLVTAEGRVLVAWTGVDRGRARVFVSQSTDDGRTFSAPRTVALPGGGTQIRPALAADRPAPQLLFLDPAGGAPAGGRLYAARLDGAAGSPLEARALASGTCECCRLDAAVEPGGSLVVLSRMIYDGGVRDFGLIREDGPGRTLRTPADDWRIDACPEHGGAVAVDGQGGYHLAWFTQGSQRQGAFYARAGGAGEPWSAPLGLGEPGQLPGHPDVLVLEGRVVVTWQQFDGQVLSVHAMESADGGRSFGAPRALATTTAPADYPRLVARGQDAFVSWYDRDAGYRLLPVANAAPAPTRAFLRDSLPAITGPRAGQPFLLVMWSVDCGPCLKELQEFQSLRTAGRPLPLVLVSTDDPARTDEVSAMLARFGLEDVESWIFADENHQQLRFAVDPRWYGELPRGYFYAPDGSRKAHSGGLTRAQIEAWLATATPTLL